MAEIYRKKILKSQGFGFQCFSTELERFCGFTHCFQLQIQMGTTVSYSECSQNKDFAFALRVACYGFRVACCALRIALYALRVTFYALRVAHYVLRLRVTGFCLLSDYAQENTVIGAQIVTNTNNRCRAERL